jgi:hypothetical protein
MPYPTSWPMNQLLFGGYMTLSDPATNSFPRVKTRYWKHTNKYGVALPHSVKEAYAIDDQTGTRFWHDAIVKEMNNVMPAFEFCDDNKPTLGHKFITCHMIFDIKSDLTRTTRLS